MPGYSARCRSSQATLSASRWFVGSSSSSRSGCSSRILHRATRRRSPPESVVDVGIARRQIHRVHGDFDLPVELPGVVQLDLVLHLGLLGEQLFHFVGLERLAKPGVDLVEAAEDRADRLDRFFDVAEHVLVGIELRLLRQIAGGEAAAQLGFAVEFLVHAGHDPQQRALAGAVLPSTPILAPG